MSPIVTSINFTIVVTLGLELLESSSSILLKCFRATNHLFLLSHDEGTILWVWVSVELVVGVYSKGKDNGRCRYRKASTNTKI